MVSINGGKLLVCNELRRRVNCVKKAHGIAPRKLIMPVLSCATLLCSSESGLDSRTERGDYSSGIQSQSDYFREPVSRHHALPAQQMMVG